MPNSPLKIGAVSYLNTKPLVFQLPRQTDEYSLEFDLPSRLAQRLEAGQLDVALIPSIELFQNPDYEIVSDACIGCRGPVLSVKLLSRCPFDEITAVALDEGSRTSVGLTKILLDAKFGLQPKTVPFPIGTSLDELDSDAVLIIGDRAIHTPKTKYPYQWDLGDQWCRWSELPFVFAMWVARRGVCSDSVIRQLEAARNLGVQNLPEIAAAEAEQVQMSPDECLTYLRDHLYFFLGAREREGLKTYYQHASRLQLAPSDWECTIRDQGCQIS